MPLQSATDPHLPELSQKGKTVLVLGGSTGIGHSIARNFCEAKASKVIIVARRADVLDNTVAKLSSSYPDTKVIAKVADALSMSDAKAMWDGFENPEAPEPIDVLVVNAITACEMGPIFSRENGTESLWKYLEINVRMPVYNVERLSKQSQHKGQKVRIHTGKEHIGLSLKS